MPTPRLPPSKRQYVAQPMPGFLELLHPKLVSAPPSGERWLHEIKFDGYRFQARVEAGAATLFTRRGHDWTERLPEIARELSALPDCILDGEVCRLRADGRPTFSGLRSAIGSGDSGDLVFFAFDLLWRRADDLRTFALKDRKAALARLIAPALGDRIRMVEAFAVGGATLLESACRMGLEGVVSKRRDSRYVAGRSDNWVKTLCKLGQEFVVGGWEQEAGRHLRSILVGVQRPEGLVYVGSLKDGFAVSPDLEPRLKALETRRNPFVAGGPPRAHVRWVSPELVARAEFREWTASGKIRHASFKGLRDDKDPREVRREQPGDVI